MHTAVDPPCRRRRSSWPALLFVSLWLATAGVRAGDLTLFSSNDFATLTPHHDDLYTSTLGLSLAAGPLRYGVVENMFTDRANGTRFDESHLTIAGNLPPIDGWRMVAEVGVVRVGNGLFGQEFQNYVHQALDNPDVELTYIDEVSWHGALRFEAARPFRVGARLSVGPRFELSDAIGFKAHILANAALDWEQNDRLVVRGTLGVRYSTAELAALIPWANGLAPAGELGVIYRDLLSVRYSYNAFGTEDHHWYVGLHWNF